MAGFTGSLAGMFMIALIAVLLYRFILELGVNISDASQKKIKKYGVWALGFMFVQILAMGIIYNFVTDESNVTEIFNLSAIWNVQAVKDYQGTPSLYILLRDLFAKLLFNRTNDCAIYISFLSAVVTGIASGFYLDMIYDEERAERLHVLFWCIPASFMVFLPSPFSMMFAFSTLYLVMAEKNKTVPAGIFALLAAMTHIGGVVALILFVSDMFLKTVSQKKKLYIRALIAAISGLLVYFVGKTTFLSEGTEFIFIASLPLVACLGNQEKFVKGEAYKYALAILTILCGTLVIKIM